MSEELKACPFCGGKPALSTDADIDVWRLECSNAGCWIQTRSYRTKDTAIAAWNRRAPRRAKGLVWEDKGEYSVATTPFGKIVVGGTVADLPWSINGRHCQRVRPEDGKAQAEAWYQARYQEMGE